MRRVFRELLEQEWTEGRRLGIPIGAKRPELPRRLRSMSGEDGLYAFGRAIVSATRDLACAFLLPYAAFAAAGAEGQWALSRLSAHIREEWPGALVILDGSFDSGEYAYLVFDVCKADAVTVNPYRGRGALQPFFEWPDKGIFVVCQSGEGGAGEIQELPTRNLLLFEWVACNIARPLDCGITVDGTDVNGLRALRRMMGDQAPILVTNARKSGRQDLLHAARNREGTGLIAVPTGILDLARDETEAPELAIPEIPGFARTMREALLGFNTCA